jgi:hypothetical protein
MTRSFALWAGGAALVAVVVAAVTIAAFPRESSSVQLPAIQVPARTVPGRPVALRIDEGQIGTGVIMRAIPTRGGAAAPAHVRAGSGSAGDRSVPATSPARSVTHPAAPTAKRVVKRQTSIGATSGPNGDDGLADGSASTGAASGRPGPGTS